MFRVLCSERRRERRGRGVLIALVLLFSVVLTFAQSLTSISGNTVTLNMGSKDGVKVGMIAYVLKDEEVSGQVIQLKIAKIKIVSVKSNSAFAKVVEGDSGVLITGMMIEFKIKPVPVILEKKTKKKVHLQIPPEPQAPPSPMDLLETAKAYSQDGKYPDAINTYEQLLKLIPGDPLAMQGILFCKKQMEAKKQETKSKQNQKRLLYFDKVMPSLIQKGEIDIAMKYLELLLSEDPAKKDYSDVIVILIHDHRTSEAKAWLDKIIELNGRLDAFQSYISKSFAASPMSEAELEVNINLIRNTRLSSTISGFKEVERALAYRKAYEAAKAAANLSDKFKYICALRKLSKLHRYLSAERHDCPLVKGIIGDVKNILSQYHDFQVTDVMLISGIIWDQVCGIHFRDIDSVVFIGDESLYLLGQHSVLIRLSPATTSTKKYMFANDFSLTFSFKTPYRQPFNSSEFSKNGSWVCGRKLKAGLYNRITFDFRKRDFEAIRGALIENGWSLTKKQKAFFSIY